MKTLDLINGSTISYSQNREDLILRGYFKSDYIGFYVDVGANDPTIDSVTKIFYQNGWSGLNIEPIKSHYKALKKDRGRDINLNVGVAQKKGVLSLREYSGSGLSTFSEKMKREYLNNPSGFTSKYTDYEVPVMPLKEIFVASNIKHIDFMKVDVEGYEYDVLASNDWSKFRPKVLCIEANHIEKDWRPLLKQEGYRLDFFDGLNEYYIDHKAKGLQKFSYVDSVVNRQPIVSHYLVKLLDPKVDLLNMEFDKLRHESRIANDRVRQSKAELERLESELDRLRNLPYTDKLRQLMPRPIIKTLKHLIRK